MSIKTYYDEVTKVWHGRLTPLIYHPNVSIAQVILNVLEKNPNRVIQVNDNNGFEMTTDQMKIETIRMALHLSKFNLTNDDCIGIVAKNNHHVAPIVTAALLIGVPINPLDPSFDSADIQHMYNLTKPKIIFCDHDVYGYVKEATDKIGLQPIFITFEQKVDEAHFVEDYFAAIEGEDDFTPKQIEDGEKSIAIISCSSGTTGSSKGVCLSHAQVTKQFSKLWPQTCNDVYLYFSSMYWISGIISMLHGLVICCKCIITTERFTPELFMKIVQKYKVTHIFGPPVYIGLTLQHPKVAEYDLSSLKYYYCGGSLVPKEYVIQAQKVFINCKVLTVYGLSEMGGLATYNTSDNMKSVGYLMDNIKMRIINDNGNNLGINEDGEIVVKPVYCFLGYKGDPELSKTVASTDGWINTGDIGRFDEFGRLFIIDRKKDMLRYRGCTISPSEVEDFLTKTGFIKSICVVGIRDILSGDLPAAVIVKTPGCVESNQEIKEIVYNLVKDSLADYKILRGGIYIVDKLPMTLSGKALRRKAQEIATELYNKTNKT